MQLVLAEIQAQLPTVAARVAAARRLQDAHSVLTALRGIGDFVAYESRERPPSRRPAPGARGPPSSGPPGGARPARAVRPAAAALSGSPEQLPLMGPPADALRQRPRGWPPAGRSRPCYSVAACIPAFWVDASGVETPVNLALSAASAPGGLMQQHSLQLLIRHKLATGALPMNSIPRVWGGPGNGEAGLRADRDQGRAHHRGH